MRLRFWLRSRWHTVAHVGDLQPGQLIAVRVEGIELALGRHGDRYFAVQRWCVHRGSDLSRGFLAAERLVCPLHGWHFSTKTGEGGGMFGACLETYPVRVIDNRIEIDPRPRKRSSREIT
jgi:nitrite reductase/ring-hydroxylating ferredoxin subunit